MSSDSLRRVVGLASLAASLVIMVAVPLAYAAPRPAPAALLTVAALCAVAGIGTGWALWRMVLRQLDRLLTNQKAESLRLDTAINNISQGLCFFDGDHRLIVCNDRYADMYGLSRDLRSRQ